jgi:hypothetical protein
MFTTHTKMGKFKCCFSKLAGVELNHRCPAWSEIRLRISSLSSPLPRSIPYPSTNVPVKNPVRDDMMYILEKR